MILALAIAVIAVGLGLALGLTPTVSRRALGPLRTLALGAVIGVAVLHLLPEALATLGLLGLVVFALGLSLPRWIARLRRTPDSHELGLELGFWGLVAHHVGDGLALGAYARLDRDSGHSHFDVLLALVLHTVPLVAVVSAGYARARGSRSAVARAAVFAGASAVGIFAAQLAPELFVERAQAWISAGVAGLLLHGMSHDMSHDLPQDRVGRVLDLIAALTGLAIGWAAASLESDHAGHGAHEAIPLQATVLVIASAAALPVLFGLLLGAFMSFSPSKLRRSKFYRATFPSGGAVLSPEMFLLSLTQLGWAFALLTYLLLAGGVALSKDSPAAADEHGHAQDESASPGARFAERLDHMSAWAFAGIAAAAVLSAALPATALAQLDDLSAVALTVFFAVGLPFHAVVAPVVGSALVGKGLATAGALALCVLGPLMFRAVRAREVGLMTLAAAVALLVGPRLQVPAITLDLRLSESALILLVGLVLARVYHLGFRGWLAPLGPREPCADHDAAHRHAPRTLNLQG